jgi:hypothetical protein
MAALVAYPQKKRSRPVMLRLEDVRTNPRNVERIRVLNRLLAQSGTPFRLRISTTPVNGQSEQLLVLAPYTT